MNKFVRGTESRIKEIGFMVLYAYEDRFAHKFMAIQLCPLTYLYYTIILIIRLFFRDIKPPREEKM